MTTIEATSCTAAKKMLRRQMIERREALSQAACQQAALAFRRTLPRMLENLGLTSGDRYRPLRVATYSAIRGEADLSLACQDLADSRGAERYYPAISGRGNAARLVFGQLPQGVRPEDFLVTGHFGVAEPPKESWLNEPPELDIVFLPGLAFDRFGNRLGWGRAFYDNLIPKLPGKPLLIGVCHTFQIIDGNVPCNEYDRPVGWLLTPDGDRPGHRDNRRF